MTISSDKLYDEDFYAWTRDQAEALRRLAAMRPNVGIDFVHLIEEVEDLGDHRLIAVRSQMRRLIEHLLKLEYSPSHKPPRGWLRTVVNARDEIADHLTTSIRNEITQELPKLYAKACKNAQRELHWQGEPEAAAALPSSCPYGFDELLDEDWYPVNRHGLAPD